MQTLAQGYPAQEGEKVGRRCQTLGVDRAISHVADYGWQEIRKGGERIVATEVYGGMDPVLIVCKTSAHLCPAHFRLFSSIDGGKSLASLQFLFVRQEACGIRRVRKTEVDKDRAYDSWRTLCKQKLAHCGYVRLRRRHVPMRKSSRQEAIDALMWRIPYASDEAKQFANGDMPVRRATRLPNSRRW